MAEPALKESNWYVIQVMTGTEERIAASIRQLLSSDFYELCFVPLQEMPFKKDGKYVTITRPLFPGYLFLITDNIDQVNTELWKLAGFTRILGTSGSFVPLSREEVEAFRGLADHNYNVSLSKGYILGDQITVTEGPLKGQEGRIKKIDRHKRTAIVEMPFLGKTTGVRVPLEIVEKRQ